MGKEAAAQLRASGGEQPSLAAHASHAPADGGGGGAVLRSRRSSRAIAPCATAAAATQKDLVEGAPIRHSELILSVRTASADEMLEMIEPSASSADERSQATEALASQADAMFRSMQARLMQVSVGAAAQALLKRNLSKQ